MYDALMFLALLSFIAFVLAGIAIWRPIAAVGLSNKTRAIRVCIAGFLCFLLLATMAGNTEEGKAIEAKRGAERQHQAQAEAEAKLQAARARISNITFSQVHRLFGVDGALTELQKEEEWKKYRGKCVEWTGQLVHLDEGLWSGVEIGFKHAQYTLTYDVIVSAPSAEKERLMALRQGRSYKYQATLREYGGVIMPIQADWGCD